MRDELSELRVEFEWVCLNVVEADEHAHRVHCYRARREGDRGVREETVEDEVVTRQWRAGEPVYRRDLQHEDHLAERTALEECYGEPIRSAVDIPFSHGTLAVNSLRAEAFSEADMAFVQELATVLSDGFGRLEDLRELQRRADEALEAGEERYRSLVEGLPVGVMHTTPRGEILYQNPYVCAMLGYSSQEMAHMRAVDLFARPEDCQELVAEVDEKGAHSFEYQLRHQSGRMIWVRGTARAVVDRAGKTVEHHGFVEDITDRKLVESEAHRIEEQLQQSRRMEAMARLTAGIAHNFNNMLQGITGNLQLALTDSPETLRPLLENADSVARRAGEMVEELTVFARQGIEFSEVEVNLWSVIANTVDLCRRTFDRRIHVVAPEPAAEAWVIGDERLLHKVLFNLTVNARDAMSETRDPTLRIAVEAAEIDEREAATRQQSTVGPFVRMSVSDNGAGMDEATRSRIFDPFFTTKPVGQGTGLGLATVYGIVAKHGGWVECESEPGKGTTFAVYLPAAVGPSEAARPADAGGSESSDQKAQTGRSRTNGSGTILIIDDEKAVRSSTARLLELVGYTVLEAEDGAEGLAIFETERSRIDLVLLDLSMPRMSGKETLSRIRRIEPDAKVVIITGYSSGEELIEGAAAVVHKPFSVKELTGAIREAVSG